MKIQARTFREVSPALACLRLLLLLGVAVGAYRTARAEDEAGAPSDLVAKVDDYVAPMCELGLFSGTVLIARGGEVLVEKAYGKADTALGVVNTTSTRFKLMSVTKCITAVGVMRLVQEGRVGLEDPVGEHLPSWPEAWQDVTVHQLLEHTSGIPNLEVAWASRARLRADRGLSVWKTIAAQLGRHPLESPAGQRSRYSNFNYVLLGLVIEAVSGKPYPTYMKSAVLDRAEMTQTGFDDGRRRSGLSIGYFRGENGRPKPSVQDMSGIRAAGDIFSTVGDLHRFDRALRGDTLLNATTRETMWKPTPVGRGYACGWRISSLHGRDCVSHSGGANGYVADFLRFPKDDVCVAALSNYAFAPVGRIARDLAAMLFDMPCEVPQVVPSEALDSCVGVYRPSQVEGQALWVRRSGRTLMAFHVRVGQPRCGGSLLVPVGGDRFMQPWGGEPVRFLEGQGGHRHIVRFAEHLPPFERVKPAPQTWMKAVGAYGATQEAPLIRVLHQDGRFLVQDSKRGSATLTLIPLTDKLAIVLYMEEFGTLLRLDRDFEGRVLRMRWQRNDGSDVDAVRHQSDAD